jgi:hypothetical protein
MKNVFYFGISVLSILIPIVIILAIIVIDMHKTGTTFTRTVPKPPRYLYKNNFKN